MGKIIFADDDAGMREMVADLLATAGHSVRVVNDGTAALAEVRAETPDLIVLDYRMGTPDGFEVCREIKQNPKLEHLPVLILTGRGGIEDRIAAFNVGANDFLPKPFDYRELLARVGALLRLSEQGRELNPTTGLPGGGAIEREFDRRRALGQRFAFCYLDLENFKAFNDRFGFSIANAAIEALGSHLRELVASTDHFAGHVGGDDFVLMCSPNEAPALIEELQRMMRGTLGSLLPPEVVERGVYLARLRNGNEEEVALTRLVGAILYLQPDDRMPSLSVLGEISARAKGEAKEKDGSGMLELEIVGEEDGVRAVEIGSVRG